jgi:hypothetical protein
VKLSRRDALAALATTSVGAVAGCSTLSETDEVDTATDGSLDDAALDVLVAAAEVLYPSDVTGVDEFVRTYAVSRVATDAGHEAGLARTARDLNEVAKDWEGAGFASLDRATRDDVLRSTAVGTVRPDPNGTFTARLRYYVVNDLLYAFYASPKGGKTVGIENPVGYPGGTESYQKPPPGERREGGSGTKTNAETGSGTETDARTNVTTGADDG